MRNACTDGEDRFGAQQPRDRFEPREPGAAQTRAWGQDLWSAVLLGFLQRQGRTAVATGGPRV
jgi:hypothetical protein